MEKRSRRCKVNNRAPYVKVKQKTQWSTKNDENTVYKTQHEKPKNKTNPTKNQGDRTCSERLNKTDKLKHPSYNLNKKKVDDKKLSKVPGL